MTKSPSSIVLRDRLFLLAALGLMLFFSTSAWADASLLPLRMPNQPVGSRCFGILPCTAIDPFGIRLRAAVLTIFRPEKGHNRDLYAARIQLAPSVTLFEWGELGVAIPITLYKKDIGVTPIYEPLQPFARVRLPLGALLRGLATTAFVRIHIAHGPFVGGLPVTQAENVGLTSMPDFVAQAMQNYQAQTQFEFGLAMQKRIGPVTASGSMGASFSTQRVEVYGGAELAYHFKIFDVFIQGQGIGVPKCPPDEAALNFCARGFRFGAGVRFDFDIGQGGILIGTGSGAVEPGWMVGAQLGLDYDEKVRRMHGDGVDAAHAWWERRFEAMARGWAAWKSASVAWSDEGEAARRASPPQHGPFVGLFPGGAPPESSPWLDGLLGAEQTQEVSLIPASPEPTSQAKPGGKSPSAQKPTAKPGPGRKAPQQTLFASANARAAAKRQLEQLPQFKLPGGLDLMTDEELAREQWRVTQEELRRAEQQQWRDSPDLPPTSKALLNGLARIPFNMLSPFLMGSPEGAAQVAEMWERLRPVKYTPEEKKYGETMEAIVGLAGELAATVGGGALLEAEKAGSQLALRAGAREAAKQAGRQATYQAAEQAALSAGEDALAEATELGGSRVSQFLAAVRDRLNPANYRVCGVSCGGGGIEFKLPKLPEAAPTQTAEALESNVRQATEHTVPAVRPETQLTKFDPEFAAQQLLGRPSVTPNGRVITHHAAERMVTPPSGRSPMTLEEVDEVLDHGTKIRKVSLHPKGDTVTVQHPGMPGKPQVVVDAETGKRVITVIRNN